MTDHIIVCPFNEKLIAKFKQRAIVVITNDFNIVNYIQQKVNRSNKLHAIKIQSDDSLSSISFQDAWKNIPLAIYADEFGDYKEFLHQLHIVRQLNIRIFLSTFHPFNFTGLKILSSLQIGCGIHFDTPENWELMNDLLHYAIYTQTNHAPIEPFNFVATQYEPAKYIDYNQVYFNKPSRFLHINEKEQIALSEQDLIDKNYIAEGIDSLDNISDNKKYVDRLNFRYDIMLKMNECAFCPSFRICQAKFQHIENKEESCKVLFSDLFDAAEFYLSKKNNRNQLWQL